MTFELMDELLKENGQAPVYTEEKETITEAVAEVEADETLTETVGEVVTEEAVIEDINEFDIMTESEIAMESYEEDAELFSNLDGLIESTMREVLNTTILESALPTETKLEHISIVESADFSEAQTAGFIKESIDPILEMMGVHDNEWHPEADQVDLPIYEVACVFDAAEKGLLEAINVEADGSEDALVTSLLGETTYEGDDMVAEVEPHLSEIFERYGIEETLDKELMITEALSYLAEDDGIDSIQPSIVDIAMISQAINSLAEATEGESTMNELIESIKLLEADDKKKGFFKAAGAKVKDTMNNIGKKASEKTDAIKDKIKEKDGKVKPPKDKKEAGKLRTSLSKLKPSGKVAGGVAAAAIGIAAIATGAALAFSKKKSACKGLSGDAKDKCMKSAAMAGLSVAQTKSSLCKDAKNPEKCQKSASKEIEKWKARVAQY